MLDPASSRAYGCRVPTETTLTVTLTRVDENDVQTVLECPVDVRHSGSRFRLSVDVSYSNEGWNAAAGKWVELTENEGCELADAVAAIRDGHFDSFAAGVEDRPYAVQWE